MVISWRCTARGLRLFGHQLVAFCVLLWQHKQLLSDAPISHREEHKTLESGPFTKQFSAGNLCHVMLRAFVAKTQEKLTAYM